MKLARFVILDDCVENKMAKNLQPSAIPVEAGIHNFDIVLDFRLCGNDNLTLEP
jgi:hypothetical protein